MNLLQRVREIIDQQPDHGALFSVTADGSDAVTVRFKGGIASMGLQQLTKYQGDLKRAGFNVKMEPDRDPRFAAMVGGVTRTPQRVPTGSQGVSYLRVTAG